MNALQLLLICFAGWINRNQQNVIEYLQEEVRVLREQLGDPQAPKADPSRATWVKGSITKQVKCDSCGHDYKYEMSRAVPIRPPIDRAAKDAGRDNGVAASLAQQNLTKMLETNCDLVPCPQCGALTREMVAEEVRQRKMALKWMGGGALMLALSAGPIYLGIGFILHREFATRWFSSVGAILFIKSVISL